MIETIKTMYGTLTIEREEHNKFLFKYYPEGAATYTLSFFVTGNQLLLLSEIIQEELGNGR